MEELSYLASLKSESPLFIYFAAIEVSFSEIVFSEINILFCAGIKTDKKRKMDENSNPLV
jgi:hypothetical protein